MIKPTVSRRVWYWPLSSEKSFAHDQPWDAGIAHVYGDDCITVSVTDELGWPQPPKQEITLAQDRQAEPGECGWMPYQVSAAADKP